MYEVILNQFRNNRMKTYELIETRSKVDGFDQFSDLFPDRKVDNDILIQVREQMKKEIMSDIISSAKTEEVYVIGHKNPDADSIFSSYLLSNILKKFGVNAHFSILKKEYDYIENDRELIKDYLPEEPLIVDNTDLKKFILVDHNILEGLNESNVIGAFDHHIISGEVFNTIEMEYASTGLLIYDLFKEIYPFSLKEKELVALTVLADTEYLCSSRYTDLDQQIYNDLNVILDVDKIQKKYFVINNFELSIEENLKKNYKEYFLNEQMIKRALIYSYDDQFKSYFDQYIDYVKKQKDHWLIIWANYESKKTIIYYEDKIIHLDYILTSTNLILKMLQNES